jgi:hypothetical protein
VQNYGGPLFRALRDAAEKTFLQLPPPAPAVATAYPADLGWASPASGHGSAAPMAVARPIVDMSGYYNAGGGCFVGSATVRLATAGGGGGGPAAFKRADEVRKGDVVQAFRRRPSDGRLEVGAAAVACVCETLLAAAPLLVTLPGGLQLTAWHPVLADVGGGTSSSQWAFPAHLAAAAGVAVNVDMGAAATTTTTAEGWAAARVPGVASLFNLALQHDAATGQPWHGCFLNGVPTIVLGHGIVGDAVATHPYYGTAAVLQDLARLDQSGAGRVQVTSADAAAAVAAATAKPAAEPAAFSALAIAV